MEWIDVVPLLALFVAIAMVWGVLLLSVRIVDRERRAPLRRADGAVVRGSWPYD